MQRCGSKPKSLESWSQWGSAAKQESGLKIPAISNHDMFYEENEGWSWGVQELCKNVLLAMAWPGGDWERELRVVWVLIRRMTAHRPGHLSLLVRVPFSLGRGTPRGRGGAASWWEQSQVPRGQAAWGWLGAAPRAWRAPSPPTPAMACQAPSNLEMLASTLRPFSGFCVDHAQRISVHQRSINPATWGRPVLASAFLS